MKSQVESTIPLVRKSTQRTTLYSLLALNLRLSPSRSAVPKFLKRFGLARLEANLKLGQ